MKNATMTSDFEWVSEYVNLEISKCILRGETTTYILTD